MSVAPDAAPIVELIDADLGYDGTTVLHHARLEVWRGEVVAVLGPNGSGKSTLVRGLLGLAELTAGGLRLFGVPATELRDRSRVGYVPQRQWAVGPLPVSVWEVVASGRLGRVAPWRALRAADRAAIDAAISVVDLDGRERTPLAELSGGQQRRALIARALAGEPDLLILDEPTAGVDAPNQVRLAETLAELVVTGTTVVLVAHELGPAAPIVTRVVGLHQGRIVYDGPPRPDDHDGGHHLHAHGDVPETGGIGLGGWDPRP